MSVEATLLKGSRIGRRFALPHGHVLAVAMAVHPRLGAECNGMQQIPPELLQRIKDATIDPNDYRDYAHMPEGLRRMLAAQA